MAGIFSQIPKSRRTVLNLFGQHMVALCVAFRASDSAPNEPTKFMAFPGTLISIHGLTCFLTAGHSLEELDKALNSDKVELVTASLVDNFGLRPVSNKRIPFDLMSAKLFYVNDDDDGLDFGLIALDAYYVRLLAANGVKAMGEKRWRSQADIKFDYYAMLGLPAEWGSEYLNDAAEARMSSTLILVQKVDSDVKATKYPRFTGKVNLNGQLTSLKGMSGGPIFGIRIGEEVDYWIVALQSCWLPQSELIFGCPIPLLMSLMTKWVEEAA